MLDPKRSNNLAIVLSQFKLSFAEMKNAILNGSEAAFTADQLATLGKVMAIFVVSALWGCRWLGGCVCKLHHFWSPWTSLVFFFSCWSRSLFLPSFFVFTFALLNVFLRMALS